MGNLQKFHGLIFAYGRSRAAPPISPVGSASYRMRPKACQMARESHTMEAIVRGYHTYKEIWCAAEVRDRLLKDQLIDQAITMAKPPGNCTYLGHKNLRVDIYFMGLIFAVCQSTPKTVKIGPHGNFPLHGTKCTVARRGVKPSSPLQKHISLLWMTSTWSPSFLGSLPEATLVSISPGKRWWTKGWYPREGFNSLCRVDCYRGCWLCVHQH